MADQVSWSGQLTADQLILGHLVRWGKPLDCAQLATVTQEAPGGELGRMRARAPIKLSSLQLTNPTINCKYN